MNYSKFFKIASLVWGLILMPLLMNAQSVDVWLTKGDQSVKLQQQSSLTFGSNGNVPNTITVNDANTYQSMTGFGFALTQGSAEALSQLNTSTRTALLNELFNPVSGNAISIVRISIGASDLSNSVYSYNETSGDVNMNNFSLAGPDQTYLIPILQDILAINPNIKVLATPWTAPTWMKTNNTWIGGSLSTSYYAAYATYFVKYLDAMSALGIDIWAITPQNEPENPYNEPSMLMNSTEQKNFINNNLGPAIASSGHATKIIAFDHNCDNTAYPIDVLNNSSYVDGAAFHLYGGNISAMSTVKNQTGKNVYFTEQFTSTNGNFSGDLGWHMQNVVIGSMRNWSKSVIEWNLATNSSYGPKTPGGCSECLGAVTVNSSSSITRNVSYYIISQVSKFVQPGAVRIESNTTASISNVAFSNPDGSKVVLAYNSSGGAQNVKVVFGGQSFVYSLPGSSAATFVWSGETNPPTIPSAPSGLNAGAQSSSSIALSWSDNSNNEVNFEVQRSPTGSGSWVQVATPGANTTGYTNTGLGASTTYYYRVRASNSAGNSAWSNTSSATTHNQPTINPFNTVEAESYTSQSGTQLETTSDTGGGQNVGYADTNDYLAYSNVDFGSGASSLEARIASNASFTGTIEFRLGSTGGALIATVSVGNTGGWQSWVTRTVSVSGASGVQNLYLVFKGGNGIGNLNWFKFGAGPTIPQAPSGLSASAQSSSSIALSWTDNSGNEVNFEVQRSPSGSGSWVQIATPGADATTYTSSGLSASTTYYYRVRASNSAGSSAWSNTANATTQGTSGGGIVSGGTYKITNKASGKVVDVSGVSTSNGARIHQWDWANGNNQKWVVESVGSGLYKLTAVHSGKVLDVVDASNANGKEIQQWDYFGNANQQWQIQDAGSGYFKIIASHSNKVLEVPGSSTSNGTKLVQSNSGSGDHQLWSFENLSGARLGEVSDEQQLTPSFSIYPNPVQNGMFTVSLPQVEGGVSLKLTDLSGRAIGLWSAQSPEIKITLPAGVMRGLYLLEIEGPSIRTVKKVHIQ